MKKRFHTNFDVPIIQKTYDFYKELHVVLVGFPKLERYSLGAKLENETIDLLKRLLTAGNCSRIQKLPALQNASVTLDVIKLLIRLAKDIRAIDTKKYLVFEEKLQEIGKMLGGWIKATKQISLSG